MKYKGTRPLTAILLPLPHAQLHHAHQLYRSTLALRWTPSIRSEEHVLGELLGRLDDFLEAV